MNAPAWLPGFDATERLGLCLAISMILHLAALFALAPGASVYAHAQAPGRFSEPRVLARLVHAEQVSEAQAQPTPASAEAPQGSRPADTPRPPSRPAPNPAALDTGALGGHGEEVAYYGEKELDVRPTPLDPIEPQDPDLTGKIRGRVLLMLQINRQGGVDKVIVVRAEPAYSFGPEAFAAFKRARFAPGRRGGIPVNSQILVEMQYGPEGN
jgi:TonB family protein